MKDLRAALNPPVCYICHDYACAVLAEDGVYVQRHHGKRYESLIRGETLLKDRMKNAKLPRPRDSGSFSDPENQLKPTLGFGM